VSDTYTEGVAVRLEGKKVAVLVAEGFEDLEYWVTVMRLQEEGAEVVSIGPDTEPVSGKNALGAQADTTAGEVDASQLDGVVGTVPPVVPAARDTQTGSSSSGSLRGTAQPATLI